jgi:hypothetical protein
MMKFLTLLLSLLDRLFTALDHKKLREEGRQQTIKEMNDALDKAIEEAEAAVTTPDPERDERLRARFDRSKNGQ